jgi:Cys-rich protein (TIGR01571 family)
MVGIAIANLFFFFCVYISLSPSLPAAKKEEKVKSREIFLHEMPFTTGLCDCCSDTGSCLDVFFCGLCHLSRVENALNFQPDKCSCICPCCALCHLCTVQDLMGQRFAPETDISYGCCTTVICASCVLCQTSRELTIRQMNPGGTCCKSGIVPSKPPAMSPAQMAAIMQQQIQMMNRPTSGV